MSFSFWLVSGKNDRSKLAEWYQLPEEDGYELLAKDQRIELAAKEILQIFPAMENIDDDHIDESPWACTPGVDPWSICMAISFSRVDEVFQALGPIFEKYELLGYDPQSEEVYG